MTNSQAQPKPQKFSLAQVNKEIAELEKGIQPTTIKEVNKVLVYIATTMRCVLPPRAALIPYYDILKDYPADLLQVAAREYIKRSTYQKFPLVGDLISKIEDDLNERKRWLRNRKQNKNYHNQPTIKYYQPQNNKNTKSFPSRIEKLFK